MKEKDGNRYCDRCGCLLTEENNKCGYELCDRCNDLLEAEYGKGKMKEADYVFIDLKCEGEPPYYYYSILAYDKKKDEVIDGFGTYDIKVLSGYLKKYFGMPKMPSAYRALTEEEKKMILELQDHYDYLWTKGKYEACEELVKAFCIINKHLTGHTGWEIDFEGSKAERLVNALEEKAKGEMI